MAKIYNQSGEIIGDIDLPEKIFNLKINPNLVHQAYVTQLANSRQVLAHTKGRGEVRGGGKKPWRQKGTGRARHASIRSPIWKGGGVAFGPTKERNFKKKINKKMKKQALLMALSSKVKDNQFLIVNDFYFENSKTKEAFLALKKVSANLTGYRESKKIKDSILIITPKHDKNIKRSVGNLQFAKVISAGDLNIREVLENKFLILLKDSLPILSGTNR